MDPNSTLEEIRRIIEDNFKSALPLDEDGSERLCDLINALDNWIVGGGFLPESWTILRK
jgi:hypothetical protein